MNSRIRAAVQRNLALMEESGQIGEVTGQGPVRVLRRTSVASSADGREPGKTRLANARTTAAGIHMRRVGAGRDPSRGQLGARLR